MDLIDRTALGRRADTVVLCAANSWDDVKLADRHMAERLTAHAQVLYVDPPVSHLTRFNSPVVADSLSRPRLRSLGPNLFRYTPLVAPKPLHRAVVWATEALVRRQLQFAVAKLDASVIAVVSTWLHLDVFGSMGERVRIYWWQDDPAGAAEFWGMSAERLHAADLRLARSSDVVAAVNDEAVRRWRDRGLNAVYLPNGCDTESFRADNVPPPVDAPTERPVAGFVGHLNSRIDLSLLEAVAAAGVTLVLIGPKDPAFEPQRFERLVALDNVRYLGQRPFEALPGYLAAMDVGLVPYGATEFNRWSFPMKTLEYLAAGLPVVSTSLPAVRWLDTPLIDMADTPSMFAAAVQRATEWQRTNAEVNERRAFAAEHSWERRAAALFGIIESGFRQSAKVRVC